MIETLRQVMEEVEQLDERGQQELAEKLRQLLAELAREQRKRRAAAIARQNAEWSEGLDDVLARIDRGERVGPVYHSEEEFLLSLGATDEELAEFEQEVADQEQ